MHTKPAISSSIFVTGISRGLGQAIFDNLIARCVFPIGIGRTFTDFQIEAQSRAECRLAACDLSIEEQVASLDFGTYISAEAKRIVFVNNAGAIMPIDRFHSLERAHFARALSINVLSPFTIAQSLLRQARSRGIPLKIVNISSGAAKRAIPGWTAYCVGKCAISMAFQCLDEEEHGVQVVDVDPGVLDTDMQAEIRAVDAEKFPRHSDFVKLHDYGLLKDPTQVAEGILTQWVLS